MIDGLQLCRHCCLDAADRGLLCFGCIEAKHSIKEVLPDGTVTKCECGREP